MSSGNVTPDALRRHLLDELLPLWRDRGADRRHGGFHSRLDHHLEPVRGEPKRLLAHARLVYAFSRAAQLGAPAWSLDAARHALVFIRERFRDSAHGGYYLTVSTEGEPDDRRKDLYTHAFLPFALAHYARASGERDALDEAASVLELIGEHLAAAEGFRDAAAEDWQPLSAGHRRQNPHMHLLEACLAVEDAGGGARARELADELVALFRRRLFDAARGCLLEHFDDDWRPLPGAEGRTLEPGHHFEWVWLLHANAARADDASALDLADALFSFAERHGVDRRHGGVYDRVDRDGTVLADTKRLWPQTERVKALAARAASGRDACALPRLHDAIDLLFARYVEPGRPGVREHATREGRIVSDAMPATSVYHLTFAITEALRVLPGAGGAGGETP